MEYLKSSLVVGVIRFLSADFLLLDGLGVGLEQPREVLDGAFGHFNDNIYTIYWAID